jgi:hypothetical protein
MTPDHDADHGALAFARLSAAESSITLCAAIPLSVLSPPRAKGTRQILLSALPRRFVLGLLADFCLCLDNLAEAICVLRLQTLIASRHSFVAGRH